ncbi:MAG TPA: hypothetical protein DCX27_03760 [Balneola sp.]|nr:hypothetical protein [Balneola sp.]
MKDDDTIRGAVANLANDLSFTADFVALMSMAAVVAIPPAAPLSAAIAAAAATTGRASAGVAVAMDLMLGNIKDAAIDAIGLIPWGKWIGKGAGATSKAAAKAGQKASSKSAQKFLQAASKSAAQASKSAENAVETLAAQLLKKAPALGEEGAKNASKAIINSVKMRIQTKLQSDGYGKDAPKPDDFKDLKEYKQALKNWRNAKKEAIEKEYAGCFKKDNSEAKNNVIKFLEVANDYVDDIPDVFEKVIGKGVDFVLQAKEFIFGDDDEDENDSRDDNEKNKPSLSPRRKTPEEGGAGYDFMRENLNLNEQRYDMLLKRFDIK